MLLSFLSWFIGLSAKFDPRMRGWFRRVSPDAVPRVSALPGPSRHRHLAEVLWLKLGNIAN
jgi:hypothetical protein